MSYATLMVNMELGRSNAGLLQLAGNLADRFDASVIGIAACQPMQMVYGEGIVPAAAIDEDRALIEKDIREAEEAFRSAMGARRGPVAWRSAVMFSPLADYIAREARSADLVITGADHGSSLFNTSRQVKSGDLVMQLGRPLLIAPTATERLTLDRVLVGWKDSRETRRAISDALPLLKQATHVTVVEIIPDQELTAARSHLNDVSAWLRRHGVAAECMAAPTIGDDASRLDRIAAENDADLIVAGAYGHSRLREWALGGVTSDLLLRAGRCAFVSH